MKRRRTLEMLRKIILVIAMVEVMFLLILAGCKREKTPTSTLTPEPTDTMVSGQTITFGDIGPKSPAKKGRRWQPLARYVQEHLKNDGIEALKVVIARNTEEMARFLRNGKVDFYGDSSFPALAVQELSGSEFILRRWKQGHEWHGASFVARRDSGLTSVEDFVGKVVAFERPDSTGGYALPAGTLIQRGFTLRRVNGPDERVAPDEIGYFFAQDEENQIELILTGKVAGGGVGEQDVEKMPAEFKEQLIVFDRTIRVPRRILSVRPGLDPEVVSKVREILVGMDQTEEGRRILKGFKKTKKYDALPPEAERALQELKEMISLLPKEQ